MRVVILVLLTAMVLLGARPSSADETEILFTFVLVDFSDRVDFIELVAEAGGRQDSEEFDDRDFRSLPVVLLIYPSSIARVGRDFKFTVRAGTRDAVVAQCTKTLRFVEGSRLERVFVLHRFDHELPLPGGFGRECAAAKFSQDSPHIEGQPEKGDKFGFALASGKFNRDKIINIDRNIDRYDDLAIGVPFEDIKSNTENDGGAVNVVYGREDQ